MKVCGINKEGFNEVMDPTANGKNFGKFNGQRLIFSRYGWVKKFYVNLFSQLMVKTSPFLWLSAKVFGRFTANG